MGRPGRGANAEVRGGNFKQILDMEVFGWEGGRREEGKCELLDDGGFNVSLDMGKMAVVKAR